MAKTYLSSVKYMIHADFDIDGIVDKPDIIGAIFGQSEGLLGDDMDLKELQKAGKVGRIEIRPRSSLGKTKGTLEVPSGMDMAQTALLGAAIESVDKVGPCEAHFKILKIEDERRSKRQEISARAKELLQQLSDSVPETQEMAEGLREEVRKADITTYGRDKLPAGPDVKDAEEVIVVEGRADVLNLLRNNIKNVIGMEGNKVPNTIVSLSKRKSLTLFADGDRGGDLIARKLQEVAKVDYIARAPDGKEVEELTGKEIHLSLRKRYSTSEEPPKRSYARNRDSDNREPERRDSGFRRERSFERDSGRGSSFGRSGGFRREYSRDRGRRDSRGPGRDSFRERRSGRGFTRDFNRRDSRGFSRGKDSFSRGRDSFPRGRSPGFGFSHSQENVGSDAPAPSFQIRDVIPSKEEETTFGPVMKQLIGTMKAKLLDASNKEVAEVNVREMVSALDTHTGVAAIVFDGIITKRLMDEADKHKVNYLVGIKKAPSEGKHMVRALTMSA